MDTYPAMEQASAADKGPDHLPGSAANVPVLTIGAVAHRLGLTLRALRFYESRGLIKPVRRGSARLYGPKDVERLAAILKAKKLGLTLTAIEKILREADSGQTLHLSRETCLAQIAVLERRLAETQEALAELRAIYRASDDPRSDRR